MNSLIGYILLILSVLWIAFSIKMKSKNEPFSWYINFKSIVAGIFLLVISLLLVSGKVDFL